MTTPISQAARERAAELLNELPIILPGKVIRERAIEGNYILDSRNVCG